MKRLLLLSLFILAAFTPALFAELPFIQDNYAQALEQAKQRKQPIFVECWAPW
jgi:sensor domain CHASE-containing protein